MQIYDVTNLQGLSVNQIRYEVQTTFGTLKNRI